MQTQRGAVQAITYEPQLRLVLFNPRNYQRVHEHCLPGNNPLFAVVLPWVRRNKGVGGKLGGAKTEEHGGNMS